MKHYRFLNGLELHLAEKELNDYAEYGWQVKHFSVVAEGEGNFDKWAYALLERDDEEGK